MVNIGFGSLIKRVDWRKVAGNATRWVVEKNPTIAKTALGVFGISEGRKVAKHWIDRHYQSVDHVVDKATEVEGFMHVTQDGDFIYDARKRRETPERVEGEFVDAPDTISETI